MDILFIKMNDRNILIHKKILEECYLWHHQTKKLAKLV
jgi:hypothetical protein